MNLDSVTNLHHPHRSDPEHAVCDLLWFPTGGGKTEAYLGLAAYTMGLRRLQGEVAGRSGECGVAVLMRYTLRLLTLQQFQRCAEGGDHHHIVCCKRTEWDQRRAGCILEEADTAFLQVAVYVGIVDHFAKQENTLAGVFIHCAESNVNSILYTITETEVTRKNAPQTYSNSGRTAALPKGASTPVSVSRSL